jgi:hypothetical protein
MLVRYIGTSEERLIEELKNYLRYYGCIKKGTCKVPYKELESGTVKYGVFTWLLDQWVLVEFI